MPAHAAIEALTAGAELRTWSVIVTIFGDMARAPGAEIPGPALSALAGAIGVKPEAMRVALHRLRKDGWIDARRAGRVSHYFLTEEGRAQSESATARIFARSAPAPDRWHVALAGPLDPPARQACADLMAARGYIALAPGAWLGAGPALDLPSDLRPGGPTDGSTDGSTDGPLDLPPDLFVLEGDTPHLPDWLRDTLAPPDLAAAYAAFDTALDATAAALPHDIETLAPLDRAAIRVLLVHGWRRLVLRHPDLPDAVFPEGWPGARVRTRVHALLDRLGETPLSKLAPARAA